MTPASPGKRRAMMSPEDVDLGDSPLEGSTILTTNKAIKDWPEIMAGDEVMATALLDRLLHHCHVFNIKGRSYRMRSMDRNLSA